MVLDYICLFISFIIAYSFRIGDFGSLYRSDRYRMLLAIVMLSDMCVDFFTEPYKNILRRGFIKEIKAVFVYCLYNIALLSIVLFVAHQGSRYSRITIALTYLIFMVMSLIVRQFRKDYLHRRSKVAIKNSNKKLLVITDRKHINTAIDRISKYNFEMFEIIGLCLIDEDRKGEKIAG